MTIYTAPLSLSSPIFNTDISRSSSPASMQVATTSQLDDEQTLDLIQSQQAGLGAALISRQESKENLARLSAELIQTPNSGGVSANSIVKLAIDDARNQRVSENSNGVAGDRTKKILTFDELVARSGANLDAATLAHFKDVYQKFVDDAIDVWTRKDELFALQRENAHLVDKLGQRHLDTVEAFVVKHGIPLEINGRGVNVPQWDDANWEGAYYDPIKDEMRFGRSGDDIPMAISIDLVAHEYGHRVLRQFVPDFQRNESNKEGGAVDESLADTFAAMVDPEFDWGIGEDIANTSLREMNEQAVTLDKFTGANNFHMMGTVLNGAAYKVGMNLGREKFTDLYLTAMREFVPADPTFDSFAKAVHNAAVLLWGEGSEEAEIVAGIYTETLARDTWKEVV